MLPGSEEGIVATFRILTLTVMSVVLPLNLQGQWLRQPTPLDSTLLLTIDFADSAIGCAAGYRFSDYPHGRAIHTTDGGGTWTQAQLPDSTWSMITLRFIDDTLVYAAGNRATSELQGVAVPSTPRWPVGSRWPGRPYAVTPEDIHLYRGQFMRSSNAGRTWFAHGVLPDSVFYLLGVSFPTPQVGYMTASATVVAQQRALVLKTTDGGATWSTLQLPVEVNQLRNIFFSDSLTGFAVGFRRVDSTTIVGTILRTTDGGTSWSITEPPGSDQIEDITVLDDSVGVAVGVRKDSTIPGYKAGIFRTTDLGLSWSSVDFAPPSVFIAGVRFSGNSGVVFGFSGHEPMPTPGPINDRELPFIAGSTDRGLTWNAHTIDQVDSGEILVGGVMHTESSIHLCGGGLSSSALVLHTGNGGVSSLEEPLTGYPDRPELHQNYPNPFNPSTTIRYQLSATSRVSLRIYDVLGREVRVLVDGERSPGAYAEVFDATDLPSGVYLYRLRAGEVVRTRKLVVVR